MEVEEPPLAGSHLCNNSIKYFRNLEHNGMVFKMVLNSAS